jgi:hypothetical protein
LKNSEELWRRLVAAPDLVQAAGSVADLNQASAIAALRKKWPTELVAAAIELVTARRKAADKFAIAWRMVADVAGVEQATSDDIAQHKAKRFAELGRPVVDLCCGIGGDAMALALVGDVTMVDVDPARVWMADWNVRGLLEERETRGFADSSAGLARAVVADVTKLELRDRPFHIDPARRAGGKRLLKFEDCQPGPGFLRGLIARCPDGAVKLSPAIDFAELPPGEVEVINRNGRLVQAVLWTGRLSRGNDLRTATRFPENISLSGKPRDMTMGRPAKYLLAVDPAVERAGLMGLLSQQLGAPVIHPALGLLTSEEPIDSPWVTAFEVVEQMPWRERKVQQWLRANGGGIVEVKTRGKAVDPDVVQTNLRGEGNRPFTLFVLRYGVAVTAWITRRL